MRDCFGTRFPSGTLRDKTPWGFKSGERGGQLLVAHMDMRRSRSAPGAKTALPETCWLPLHVVHPIKSDCVRALGVQHTKNILAVIPCSAPSPSSVFQTKFPRGTHCKEKRPIGLFALGAHPQTLCEPATELARNFTLRVSVVCTECERGNRSFFFAVRAWETLFERLTRDSERYMV